jgi:hypothetical protein
MSVMTTRKATRARKVADPDHATGAKSAAVRHGAITRTQLSYSTYKRWSDQMKSGWEGSEDPNR